MKSTRILIYINQIVLITVSISAIRITPFTIILIQCTVTVMTYNSVTFQWHSTALTDHLSRCTKKRINRHPEFL